MQKTTERNEASRHRSPMLMGLSDYSRPAAGEPERCYYESKMRTRNELDPGRKPYVFAETFFLLMIPTCGVIILAHGKAQTEVQFVFRLSVMIALVSGYLLTKYLQHRWKVKGKRE